MSSPTFRIIKNRVTGEHRIQRCMSDTGHWRDWPHDQVTYQTLEQAEADVKRQLNLYREQAGWNDPIVCMEYTLVKESE